MNLIETTKVAARLYAAFRSCNQWRGVRYLTYHSVGCFEKSESAYTITAAVFRRQMEIIRDLGIPVVSLPASLRLLENGMASGGQYIVITFDDGYQDGHTVAWPILREFGFTAHFFIIFDSIGVSVSEKRREERGGIKIEKTYMNADALRQLLADGATIGSHSATHRPLASLTDKEVERELEYSRKHLEEMLSTPIETFAYPYAAYNQRVIQIINKIAYKHAFGIGMGYERKLNDRNRFTLRRNVVSNSFSEEAFTLMVCGGYDWARIYQSLKQYAKMYRRQQ